MNTEQPKTHTTLVYKLALPILVIDQISKWLILQNMPLNTQHIFPSLDPWFKLTHVANTGSVFGLFPDTRWLFTVLAFAVTAGMVWFNQTLQTSYKLPRVALGFILGGAIGNLIDRIWLGHVTDFLDFDFSSILPFRWADWYIFNVADMAVVSGAIILGYLSLFAAHKLDDEDRDRDGR